MPAGVLDRLRRQAAENARRSLRLTRELVAVVRLGQSHGIPLVSLKGPILSLSVYGDIALRQFADLDVLVHRADVSRARELLLSCGYRPQLPLTHSQYPASLPDSVRRTARQDRAVGALAAQVRARLFDRPPGTPLDLWDLYLFRLRARERWRDRLRYCVRLAVVPTPADLAWLRLPGALAP